MISIKQQWGWVLEQNYRTHRFSGPYCNTYWWVNNKLHRLYGFQATYPSDECQLWIINSKSLYNFKKSKMFS